MKTRPKKKRWCVYIIQTSNGKLYTGITTDLERRFSEHQTGKRGAKFFRSTRAEKILHTETDLTLSKALKREWAIKKMPAALKRKLAGIL